MKHTLKTNLFGLKRWAWKKNLDGFFSLNGKPLTDNQVRTMVEWAISKGYTYDVDIPEGEVVKGSIWLETEGGEGMETCSFLRNAKDWN